MMQIPSMQLLHTVLPVLHNFTAFPSFLTLPRAFCQCTSFVFVFLNLYCCETIELQMGKCGKVVFLPPSSPTQYPKYRRAVFLIQKTALNFLMARRLLSHTQLSSLYYRSCGKDGPGAMATSSPRWAVLECT